MEFDRRMLDIDAVAETERLTGFLRDSVRGELRRQGAVLGISGGVDSAVVLALCARAFGPERVLAVMLPEKESDPESERLAREAAAACGVEPARHEITAVLEAFGCYRMRDDAIRRVFPEYEPARGYRAKLVLPPDLLERDALNIFSLAIEGPGDVRLSKPAPPGELRQITAASAFKQRTRMAVLYYYAELKHFAVIGTPNKNEHDQGFFVKHGDGGADVRPIVHLFKTQVYQLAEHLGVPEEIRRRPPTTDTYSAPCTQEEFFFRLPFAVMDLLWCAMERGIPTAEAAAGMGLTEEQVRRVYNDLERKARTTAYLRMAALEPSARETACATRV